MLYYAGIDEAGYGPMLGPLCIGSTLFKVKDCEPAAGAPDLLRGGAGGLHRMLPGEQARPFEVLDHRSRLLRVCYEGSEGSASAIVMLVN